MSLQLDLYFINKWSSNYEQMNFGILILQSEFTEQKSASRREYSAFAETLIISKVCVKIASWSQQED